MIKKDLVSLLKCSSPLDYPILTPLVSFILLCASFEAGLSYSWGTLTLTELDHVSIMKSSVCPTLERGGITGQSDPKHSRIYKETLLDHYIGRIGSKTRRYKEINIRHAGQSHLMRVT